MTEPERKRAPTSNIRHVAGRLTARERLEVLFDDARFDTLEVESRALPPAHLLAKGRVEGRLVYAASRDACVRQGALTAAEIRDLGAMLERATETPAPSVILFDGMAMTAGDDAASLEAMAALHATLGLAAAPRIALVLGPCLGPDALLAALSDFVIISAAEGFIASGGPAVVQALTQEILTGQEIGGPAVHMAANTLMDCVANDVAALCRARRLIDVLPDHGPGITAVADDAAREEPSLDLLVPVGQTDVYDMRELLAAIADDGDFLEIAPECAPNIVIGFARFGGRPAGILANQPNVLGGVLDVAALTKALRFVDRCSALSVPLLSVVDCPGLLPGLGQERAGLLLHAAALIRALALYNIPRVAVVVRNAIGPVASLMGIGHGATYRWPSAHIALSGGDGDTQPSGPAPPRIGPIIAPRETRRWILAALVGAGSKA